MGLLETIREPRDLRSLDQDQLEVLAREIRDLLISSVARTTGHLGPNLGVVELTIALHRVFDSPRDVLLFDTGHQSYVHKLLTGRQDRFHTLRQEGGLSGYASREESEHDIIENSHASTALAYADGLAKGFQLKGETDRTVVAVIGDGALTGGMAWEGLNNIAAADDRPVVIVVNDNERSYAPTIGGLADHLRVLRTTQGYERFLDWGRTVLERTPVVGGPIFGTLHGMKRGIRDMIAPQGMFEDLGLKYVGPVDGHDEAAVEGALRRARAYDRPVLVHVITRKGHGYAPAELFEPDLFHSVGVIDPETGEPLADPKAGGQSWTSIFADELVAIGADRPDIVGITAAMAIPVGLDRFALAHPDRMFDVGIAEQHAVTSAAGMATAGLHPVVAVYATFLNRAFDQVLFDVGLHRCGVTIVLDRAGITGDDGASHNGIWDLVLLQPVPGLRIAAPRDASTLRQELREAVAVSDAPTVLRFAKGVAPASIPAIDQVAGMDVLRRDGEPDVLLVSVGALAPICLDVADRLIAHGIGVTVVDPRWVKPVNHALCTLGRDYRLVVTVEDGLRDGGVGTAVATALRRAGVRTPVTTLGVPTGFLPHAKRAKLLADCGLTAQDISRTIVEAVAGLDDPAEAGSVGSVGSVGSAYASDRATPVNDAPERWSGS